MSATVAMATILRNDSSTRRSFVSGPTGPGEDSVSQLECHTRAAEIRVGIIAIRAIGINHGERGRKFRFGQVMIGNDGVDAKLVLREIAAAARMPLSTLTMRRVPRTAASSTAAGCIP